jgi:multidrug transporter EmrE-like cation transporter
MAARTEGLIFIAIMIVVSFVFQIQLKILADELAHVLARQDLGLLSKMKALTWAAVAWRPIAVAVLAVLLFALWFLTLTRLELSVALPVVSIGLLVNAIGGGLMLGEPLSPLRIIGVVTVAAGVFMVLKS